LQPTISDLLEPHEIPPQFRTSGIPLDVETAEPVNTIGLYNRSEALELARYSLDFLAGLANPTSFTYTFPELYKTIWKHLCDKAITPRDFSKFLLGLPRGHAKTTLMKLFVLWCILYSQKMFILIVASRAGLAENILLDICAMLDQPNIVSLFGNWRLNIEIDRQELKNFVFLGRKITLAALGAESEVRGINLGDERPDVILMEDIQSRENANSKDQSEKLETWMLSTLLKAKSPRGCIFIFIGNMYVPSWCIIKKLKTNRFWLSIITGGILADGTALWEELQPLEQLLEEFETDLSLGHPEIFYAEVLNDDSLGFNTRYDLTKLPELPYTEFDLPQGGFIIIDTATDKDTADDTSIIRYDVYDQIPVAVEVIAKILSPSETIRLALEMALRNNIRIIGVETVGYQYSLLHWFGIITEQLHIEGLELVELNPSGKSKNYRIGEMLKGAMKREVYWAPQVKSIIENEITQWNPLKRDNTDNIIDNIAYAQKFMELYGNLCYFNDSLKLEDLSESSVVEDNCCF
jgi:hypothetical protein